MNLNRPSRYDPTEKYRGQSDGFDDLSNFKRRFSKQQSAAGGSSGVSVVDGPSDPTGRKKVLSMYLTRKVIQFCN